MVLRWMLLLFLLLLALLAASLYTITLMAGLSGERGHHVHVYTPLRTGGGHAQVLHEKPGRKWGAWRPSLEALNEAIRGGVLLVAPPAGRGLLERGVPNTTYPLWDRLAAVNTSDPRVHRYLEWVYALIREGPRSPERFGFDDAVVLPRRANLEPPRPLPNATARMGTVLLPYGFAVTTVIYPCGAPSNPQLCAVVHMYAWNKTGLAQMVWRTSPIGLPEQWLKRELRVLWVVEWPVDARHSAVLVYNGTRVTRVSKVYVVLEEPVIVTNEERLWVLYKFGKWFWAMSGVAGGIAQWLAGNTLNQALHAIIDKGLAGYATYRDEYGHYSQEVYVFVHHGGVCLDYTVAAIELQAGLTGLPSLFLDVGEGHATAAIPASLARVGNETFTYTRDPLTGVLYNGKWRVTFDTGAIYQLPPGYKYIWAYIEPPFLMPDALDYWFFWRGFVDKLPWWLISPWAANTTLGRASMSTPLKLMMERGLYCDNVTAWWLFTLHGPAYMGYKLDASYPRVLAPRVNATPTGEKFSAVNPIVYMFRTPSPPPPGNKIGGGYEPIHNGDPVNIFIGDWTVLCIRVRG